MIEVTVNGSHIYVFVVVIIFLHVCVITSYLVNDTFICLCSVKRNYLVNCNTNKPLSLLYHAFVIGKKCSNVAK